MTLRVILQIVPFGDESQIKEIGRLNISNVSHKEGRGVAEYPDGSHDDRYVIEVNDYKNYNDKTPRVFHKRSQGAWKLVQIALNKLKL